MPENKRTASGALGGIVGLVGLSAAAGVLVTAAVTPAIAVSGLAASSAITIFDNMPSYLQPDQLMLPTTITAGDQVLAKFYDQNRSPVTFDQINPVMYDAILSSEDPRYYQHGGVDLIGTTRALLSNAAGGETQGGSSISQQYVKNVLVQRCERDAKATDAVEATDTTPAKPAMTRDEALQACAEEAVQAQGAAGYQRKLQEMRYAVQLEKQYTKDQILLGYLNIANFGGVTYGIDAAARYYFNVPASQLNIGQAAILAGMVQNPNRFRIDREGGSIVYDDGTTENKKADGSIDDVAQETIQGLYTLRDNGEITQEQLVNAADGYSETKGRQLYVLSRMEADGKITHAEYVQYAIEPITPQITPTEQGCGASKAPYFCQLVVGQILSDPAFGAEDDDRVRALRQDGLTIQTTLDWRVQDAAQATMNDIVPASTDGLALGSTALTLEAKTGRVLALTQNTKFTQDPTQTDPSYNSIVFAGDKDNGGSIGFNAGSTFKIFTLVDWLEKGNSLNAQLNGRLGPVPNMKNTCSGDWINTTNYKINNFANNPGYYGTPLRFTKDSLNTGYLAMAAQLDLCDIANVAKKMGVGTTGDGTPIEMKVANEVIGSDNVSPLAMAGAFATVANGGSHCQPKLIDKVTDPDGAERPIPARTCETVLTPEIAATAAYALQGVMSSGGTGQAANPNDGTPVMGKTGTHEAHETWMIESSTNATTAVWVGNWDGGQETLFGKYANGYQLSDMRYAVAKRVQSAADEFYGGDRFPDPAQNLLRTVTKDVPNVVGRSIDDARNTLQNAGFSVTVGDPVDAEFGGDRVAAQNPSGSAPAGANITINPGNGQGGTVPDVTGQNLNAAQAALKSAGYDNLSVSCKEDGGAPDDGRVTATNPAGGTSANKSTPIVLEVSKKKCQ